MKDIFKDLYVRKLDKYKENLLLVGDDVYSYHNAEAYQQHKDSNNPPHTFQFGESGWKGWDDFDVGAIVGIKLKDNFGIFAEGKYLYYWNKPAYDFKVGANYQFVGW